MPELKDSADIVWTRTGDEIRGTVVGSISGGGGGVTDHGDLTGLDGDDHPQYLTIPRHTSRSRHDVSVLDSRVPVYIWETSPGVWSGIVPTRPGLHNPAILVGESDPTGPNGPQGQNNIKDGDKWEQVV